MAELESGDRLSTAVGDSGRRARRDLRVLWGVAVLTLVGVLVPLQVAEGSSSDSAAVAAGAAELEKLSAHDATAGVLSFQLADLPDLGSANAAQIGSLTVAARTAAAGTWERFAARPPLFPGEVEMRERYQSQVSAGDEWFHDLVDTSTLEQYPADPVVPDAAVSALPDRLLQQGEVLGDLRRLYTEHLATAIADEEAAAGSLRDNVVRAVLAGLATLAVGFVLLERAGRRRAQVLDRVEGLLENDRALAQLEGQLTRALEICDDEQSAYGILERAIGRVLDDGGAELLVADSSLAHLVPTASLPDAMSCPVACPAACPAVRRGHTQRFPNSDALDACPHVRDRGGDHQTACVPFTVAGNSVGVLHVTTPGPLPAPTLTHIELIARKTGERVGVARAFAKSEDQARTDPLTGLLNRRSLEERAREFVESRRPYAVVFADLDHFKTLNDVHGHEVGDRALRLFSRCLREAVRPADVAARYGGEEFVVVLPDCDSEGANVVVNRLRQAMDERLNSGTVPRFTASFGITEAVGGPLAAKIAEADTALLAAKRGGRNQSVLWTPALGIVQEHRQPEGGPESSEDLDGPAEFSHSGGPRPEDDRRPLGSSDRPPGVVGRPLPASNRD